MKVYEFRLFFVPFKPDSPVANREGIRARARYEHAFCPMGRKQGPILHSLTLLPQEQVRIFEYDRYRRTTSTSTRFSTRSSFFSYINRVNDRLTSIDTKTGMAFSQTTSVAAEGGAGLDLGFFEIGGGASASSTTNLSGYLDVESVFTSFSHTAEISSRAVETERSIVVSTFEDTESAQSTARTLRNDNPCHAVTYFVRQVQEVYCLTTRLVGIDVLVGNQWVELGSASETVQKLVLETLRNVRVGLAASQSVEITLPTDGLLYEAELSHCGACDPVREKTLQLELARKDLENQLLQQEIERRKALVVAGKLDPFEPCCPASAEAG